MDYIPQILLVENVIVEDEAKLFLAFLHHPYYVQKKNSILSTFPGLKELLQTTTNEEETVQLFLNNFYNKNKEAIGKCVQRNKNILDQDGNSALKALLDIMTYSYREPVVYEAIPTVLPFSPYKDNAFYFSIFGEINGRIDKNVLIIGIHEISHLIFEDLLCELKTENNIELKKDAKSYLKEALAVVILNQEALHSILNLNNYKGNPEIQNLQIQKVDDSIVSFVDFLQEYYCNIIMDQHKPFKFFLTEVATIISSITPEMTNKRLIWNQYGKKILTEPTLTQIYSEPIKIKEG